MKKIMCSFIFLAACFVQRSYSMEGNEGDEQKKTEESINRNKKPKIQGRSSQHLRANQASSSDRHSNTSQPVDNQSTIYSDTLQDPERYNYNINIPVGNIVPIPLLAKLILEDLPVSTFVLLRSFTKQALTEFTNLVNQGTAKDLNEALFHAIQHEEFKIRETIVKILLKAGAHPTPEMADRLRTIINTQSLSAANRLAYEKVLALITSTSSSQEENTQAPQIVNMVAQISNDHMHEIPRNSGF